MPCAAGSDPRYFLSARSVGYEVAGDRLPHMLELATRRWTDAPGVGRVYAYATSGSAYRMAEIAMEEAHVSFITGAATADAFDWQASLAAVVEPLTRAPWAVRGFVKRDWSLTETAVTL